MVDSHDGGIPGSGEIFDQRVRVLEVRVVEVDGKVDALATLMIQRFDAVDIAIREQREYTECVYAPFDPRIIRLERAVGSVLLRLDRLEGRIDGIDGRLDKLAARVNRLESAIARLETRIDSLEARMTALETRIDRLERKVDDLTARMETGFSRLEHKLDQRLERR
jgi:chromosome segregation ATPase